LSQPIFEANSAEPVRYTIFLLYCAQTVSDPALADRQIGGRFDLSWLMSTVYETGLPVLILLA